MDEEADIGPSGGRKLQVRARTTKRLTIAKCKRFLEHLSGSCNVRAAAAHVGVNPTTLYSRRRVDPAFAEQWRCALLAGYDRLEEALLRRAIDTAEAMEADPEAVVTGPMDIKTAVDLLNKHRATVEGRERGTGRGRDTRATQAETDAALTRKLEQLAKRLATSE